MSVVFITIPGNERHQFARDLSRKGVPLDLVIVQLPQKKPLLVRAKRFFERNFKEILKEGYYALLLRFDRKARERLSYFFPRSNTSTYVKPHSKTIEVDSINSDEVYQILTKLRPDLLVVWGNTILDQRILSTARRAINLHFGLCPFYRGALANQYAIISNDHERLGATIHFINGKPDAGEILATVLGDLSLPPRELFNDLHTRAVKTFLEIVHDLARGRKLIATSQDIAGSRNLLLKHWKPSIRYQLAREIRNWEEAF